MGWVLRAVQEDGQQKFMLLSEKGRVESVNAAALATEGIPFAASSKRVVYTGEISTWSCTSADEYLRVFGVAVSAGLENRHTVFRSRMADGTTVLVPALALMRGLLRPHRTLLPLAFTPSNVDTLGFVDYSRHPPTVVLDAEPESSVHIFAADVRFEPLRWFHASRSARQCAQSVYEHALNGQLGLHLPRGVFQLVLHGLKIGSTLFVTKLNVTSVTVCPEDNIASVEQTFLFHGMAAPERKVSSVPDFPVVPVRPGRHVALTNEEWVAVEPLFESSGTVRQRHCRRGLLDAILLKLSSAHPWKVVQQASGFDKTTLTTTFRRWQLDGRLSRVLTELEYLRGAVIDHST
jgi:Putative transposase of IS4/5 family (DUF4096)